MKTEVLFINPGNPRGAYQGLLDEFTAIAPPLWSLLLAHHVRKQGYPTAIYDVNIEGWNENTANELLAKHNPELIVLLVYGHHPSASTQTMPIAGKIARDLKTINKDIPIIMGGTHPSALPERTLREEAIDFVAQGEGVYTISQLLAVMRGQGTIADVPGLWRCDRGSPVCGSPARLVADLDGELEAQAWDLLPSLGRYRAHNMHCFQYFSQSKREDFTDVRSPYVTLFSSLGCPYSCSFCCINAVYGKPSLRYWSLEKVVSWLDYLVAEHNIRNVRFDDELFILEPHRSERLCDMLAERGYDLNIQVYARVDSIKESLLEKLKKAGVSWIALGIEAAAGKVREGVGKRTRADVFSVVRNIQKHDIGVLGNYIFGLPDDNLETMNETLELALTLQCEFVNFYCAMAYPGSLLYKEALAQGWTLPERWDGFSQLGYECLPLTTKHLSAATVLAFRDAAFERYFTNPHYWGLIKEKYGKTVVGHIERMLQIKLARKILGNG